MKYDDNGQEVEIIKPKSKQDKRIEDTLKKITDNKSLLSAVIMGLIGIIFLTNSNDVILYGLYIVGALITGFGLYNVIQYLKLKKDLKIEDEKKLTSGIIIIAIGLAIILLASIVQTFLNILIGVWLIATGALKIISVKKDANSSIKTKNFNYVEALIYIAMGLYSILFQNIVLTIIGIWMIIGASIEIYDILKNKDLN